MKKEQSSREEVLQIIREVANSGKPKKKKNRKMVETDIDIFALDERETRDDD